MQEPCESVGPTTADIVEELRRIAIDSGSTISTVDRGCLTQAADEIERLRDVLQFADGACVHGTGSALSDLYQPAAPAQEILQRAGCWPRGSHRSEVET